MGAGREGSEHERAGERMWLQACPFPPRARQRGVGGRLLPSTPAECGGGAPARPVMAIQLRFRAREAANGRPVKGPTHSHTGTAAGAGARSAGRSRKLHALAARRRLARSHSSHSWAPTVCNRVQCRPLLCLPSARISLSPLSSLTLHRDRDWPGRRERHSLDPGGQGSDVGDAPAQSGLEGRQGWHGGCAFFLKEGMRDLRKEHARRTHPSSTVFFSFLRRASLAEQGLNPPSHLALCMLLSRLSGGCLVINRHHRRAHKALRKAERQRARTFSLDPRSHTSPFHSSSHGPHDLSPPRPSGTSAGGQQ